MLHNHDSLSPRLSGEARQSSADLGETTGPDGQTIASGRRRRSDACNHRNAS